MTDPGGAVTGVVLAAGGGTRFGSPKALARDADGVPWLTRVVDALRAGGCDEVAVVLGAAAAEAAPLVPAGARAVIAAEWSGGLSHSVRAAITAADGAAVILAPVDVPALPAAAVARVRAGAGPELRSALVRATYRGIPGHPVLIGADHWPALAGELHGDTGAGAYLSRVGARTVACEDLWSGEDVDTPG